MGLVKSGKSTLLNAFLGDEYLPAANTPETTRIVRVVGTRGPGTLAVGTQQLARGTSAINEHLREANHAVRVTGELKAERLTLTAPLAFMEEVRLETRGFEILDTPGPNEAGVRDDLRAEVVQILGDVDAIIYLLDYTKLKTSEEESLLALLAEMRPELIRRCSERLFFVVNKIDTEDRNGLSPEATRTYVAELLRRTFSDIEIREDRILPISANNALLARMVQTDLASDEALADFRQIAFGKIMGPKATPEQCRMSAPQILDHSGVLALESEVLTYIFENRGRLFHQSLTEELERCLQRLGNYLLTVQGSLQIDHQELEAQLTELKTEISTVMEGLQRLTNAGETTKAEVGRWVRGEFDAFDAEVQGLIRQVLSEQPPRERESGWLMGVWRSVRALVTDLGPGTRAATQLRISGLNRELERLLDRQFHEFRAQLEQQGHDRQSQVLDELNDLIQPLARSIEQKVNQSLQINLSPVYISIPTPSLAQFNRDINAHMSQFMVSRIRHEHRVTTERKRVPAGLCSPSRVIEKQVRVNTPVEEHSVSVDALKRVWRGVIQQLTATSIETAEAVLDAAFETIHETARAEVERYANSFTRTIEREIRESEISKEQRAARIAEIQNRKASADSLREVARNLIKQVDRSAASAQVNVIASQAEFKIAGGDMIKNETTFNGGVQTGVAVGGNATVNHSTVMVGTSADSNGRVHVDRDAFERDVTEILAMLVDAREEIADEYESVRTALRKLHQLELARSEELEVLREKFAALLTEQDKNVLQKLEEAQSGIAANLVSSGLWDYLIKPLLG